MSQTMEVVVTQVNTYNHCAQCDLWMRWSFRISADLVSHSSKIWLENQKENNQSTIYTEIPTYQQADKIINQLSSW